MPKERSLVQRLGEDVGSLIHRGDPLDADHVLEVELSAVLHPALVVLSPCRCAWVYNYQSSRVFGMDGLIDFPGRVEDFTDSDGSVRPRH